MDRDGPVQAELEASSLMKAYCLPDTYVRNLKSRFKEIPNGYCLARIFGIVYR
jgi:hypothetical protein